MRLSSCHLRQFGRGDAMSRFSYNKIQYRSNCHGWFRAAIQSCFWNAEARPTQIRMTLQPLVNPVRHLMLSLTIEVGSLAGLFP
jgi:hypothetical protein